MYKRWIRRRLPVFIFTFFIILYVDFQLRTSSVPKLSVVQHPLPGPHQRATAQVPSSDGDAQNQSTRNSSRNGGGGAAGGVAGDLHITDWSRRHRISRGSHVTRSKLKQEDIFIAVKTTGRFHKTRLALLLETWISRTKDHTFIFTDAEDEDLSSQGYNMVVTGCQSDHSQQALSCKMSAEYDGFMASDKRWFCHVDDDNYVNPEALLSLLLAFPQDGDIYVGKPSLDKPITAHELLEGNATV